MVRNLPGRRFPGVFFLLVFALSLPFWAIGAVQRSWLPPGITINLPISALMFVCPGIAASVLAYRKRRWVGVKHLWRRSIDVRIDRIGWYLPAIFLLPVLMLVEYGWLRASGSGIPPLQFPMPVLPISLAVFLVSGICEETGWSGYATGSLQDRWGALGAGLLIGAVWGVWHGIPYLQAHNPPWWVVWQVVSTVGNRVLIVWLYNNTAGSVFVASVFHAMYNVCFLVLFPVYGSYYNPFITSILNIVVVVAVVSLWGPKTLSRFRVPGVVRETGRE